MDKTNDAEGQDAKKKWTGRRTIDLFSAVVLGPASWQSALKPTCHVKLTVPRLDARTRTEKKMVIEKRGIWHHNELSAGYNLHGTHFRFYFLNPAVKTKGIEKNVLDTVGPYISCVIFDISNKTATWFSFSRKRTRRSVYKNECRQSPYWAELPSHQDGGEVRNLFWNTDT